MAISFRNKKTEFKELIAVNYLKLEMKKLLKKSKLIFCLSFLTLTSCVTVLNRPVTKVKISSETNSKLIFLNDTINISQKPTTIRPLRSKQALKLTVFNDSLQNDFLFKRKISEMYWANIFAFNISPIGFGVDLFSDKRFGYESNVHFKVDSISSKIIVGRDKVSPNPKKTFLIYTSPLQAFDFFSVHMPTIGTEYFINKRLSSSIEFGYNPNPFFRNTEAKINKEYAYLYKTEFKYYPRKNFFKNVRTNEYFSFEYKQINSQFNDKISYSLINNNFINANNDDFDDWINDTFVTQKKVSVFNIKYGFLVPIRKRFYFDFYTGMGLRLKNYNYVNLEYDPDIHYIDDFGYWIIPDYTSFTNEKRQIISNFSLGFKFGIKL